MTDLTDTTFLIPTKIESNERLNNAISVLGYLNHHFKTNVFICEVCDGESKMGFSRGLTNLNIKYFSRPNGVFYKTSMLNEMLREVKTKVTCQYDIDVFFEKSVYLDCQNAILTGDAELIYPYPHGQGQVRVFQDFDRSEFNKTFDIALVKASKNIDIHASFCGHACFLNTEVYKKLGGENEEFVSYGPEDTEKLVRFFKLGAKMARMERSFVYHFEHSRGSDSDGTNPYFYKNNVAFEKIKTMSPEEIRKQLPPIS